MFHIYFTLLIFQDYVQFNTSSFQKHMMNLKSVHTV